VSEASNGVKIDKIIAEERMLAVERQVHAIVPKGAERVILCPYCQSENLPHVPFCCETLRHAIVTVLVADRALAQAAAAEKAMQN
jgi:hypothetical protein